MTPWLVGVGAGACVALLLWLVGAAAQQVPSAERMRHADELPAWWRWLWPLAACAGWYLRDLMSWRWRRSLEQRIQRAGLRHRLQAHQVAGAQCASALVAAGLAWVVGAMLVGEHTGAMRPGLAASAAALAWWLPALWLRDRAAQRAAQILRALPFVLDMATLCMEAGLNLQGALQQSVAKGPPGPLRDELQRMLGEVRAGVPRMQALRDMATRLDQPAVRSWVSALVQADALGMNLGPILRAQSDQRRAERFLRAEKLALQAPVKMLFPLVVFIFPCTFLVIAFPIAIQVMEMMEGG